MSAFAKPVVFLLVLAMALLLAACEEDEEIKVLTVSGDKMSLNGTWAEDCYADGSDGAQTVAVIDGKDLSLHFESWSGDTSCSGTPTDDVVYQLKAKRTGEKTATWKNGTAPGDLPDSVTVSTIYQHLKGDATVEQFDLALIDDTADPKALYGGNTEGTFGSDGYPDELRTDGLYKQ